MAYSPTLPAQARTLPATIASLALGPLPARVGRRLGQRVEVDVDAVRDRMGASASARLLRYYRQVLRFRDGAGGGYVDTRRTLVQARQREVRGGRNHVLTDELAGLGMVAGVGSVVEAFLDKDQDLRAVRRLGAPLRARVHVDGHTSTLTMLVPAVGEWPAVVGGPVGPDECYRQIVVTANHARSRYKVSRARRMVALEVVALERFPDPSQV